MAGHRFPVRICLILWLFWIVLVGRLDWASIAVGSVVAFIVSWVDRDIVVESGTNSSPSLSLVWRWIAYFARLSVAVVKANVQVAGIVLHPRLRVQPTIATFRSCLRTDMSKMILGNSITLTPGTVTVDVTGDLFIVHALTLYHARSLADRSLESILAGLEQGGAADGG